MNITVRALDELDQAARSVLDYSAGYKFFIFEGEMGAGKTTFIKSLCGALGVTEVVSSPTFSIINEYHAKETVIYHFDFYRIKSLQEAFDIGYEEYFYSGNICLIEWPEKIAELLPDEYVKVSISTISPTERLLAVSKL